MNLILSVIARESGQSSPHDERMGRRQCFLDPPGSPGSSACADEDGGEGDRAAATPPP